MVTSLSKIKKSLSLIALIGVSLSMTACKTTFSGVLDAKEELSLNVKKKVVKVEAGQKNASLHINSKTDATLEIHLAGNNNNIKATFKIPTQEIPENGTFKVSAATLKQAYDAEGEMKTDVRDTEIRDGLEFCQRRVYAGSDCYTDDKGRIHCHPVYEYVTGERYVEYFDRITTRDLKLELIKDSRVAAEFTGANESSQRIYTRVGACY